MCTDFDTFTSYMILQDIHHTHSVSMQVTIGFEERFDKLEKIKELMKFKQ